jgi:hypothetical protein
MQKSNINPACLQQMLESAANAAEKGQSQFFTPLDFGRYLAQALPAVRPVIVDLNCGAGHLLQASANDSTRLLLGNDIDPARPKIEGLERPRHIERITSDITRSYALLAEIDFQADLFVLNPPWRLWWDRDRLKDIPHTECDSVSEAFIKMEEGAYRKGTVDGTIDSTIATLMMALARCSHFGEGLLIANNATLERLIFTPGAPHADLARHIWAHIVVPGNPMTGIDDCLWERNDGQPGSGFNTGVIYFARSHYSGPRHIKWTGPQGPLPDRVYRMGSEISRPALAREDQAENWQALKERLAELAGHAGPTPFNLWLTAGGRIGANLSVFQEKSVKLDKSEAARLFKLRGRTPMDLVLQRAQRDELLHTVHHPAWKVDPELIAAVEKAVTDYHAARAPLYPLPPIQRLGYLDEQDTIECRVDLLGLAQPDTDQAEDEDARPAKGKKSQTPPPQPELIFRAGQRYSVRTQTVNVTRVSRKPNPFTGKPEDLEHTGQELAIYIRDGIDDPAAKESTLKEYCFMDAKIQDDDHTTVRTGKSARDGDRVPIDFTLQQLADHFVIPEVPDVATTNPEGYKQNLAHLTELEVLTEALN